MTLEGERARVHVWHVTQVAEVISHVGWHAKGHETQTETPWWQSISIYGQGEVDVLFEFLLAFFCPH